MSIVHLKANWLFPLLTAAFYFQHAPSSDVYAAGMLLSILTALVLASLLPSMRRQFCSYPPALHVLSAFSAVGVCLGEGAFSLLKWRVLSYLRPLSLSFDPSAFIAACILAGSMLFAYAALMLFYQKLSGLLRETSVFNGLHPAEIAAYAAVYLLFLVLCVCVFTRTGGFYHSLNDIDILYTSDSPLLVRNHVYVTLAHQENDLRQPLFAAFAAPFCAPAHLIAQLLGANPVLHAVLLNAVQLALLLLSNLLLARLLRLDAFMRVCFVLLASCAYPQLLFSLMMEQYIIAYFYLILLVFLIAEGKCEDRLALWAAGGTLLTSVVLAPLLSRHSPLRSFRRWLKDMVLHGAGFLALLLLFGRFDVLYSSLERSAQLSSFTAVTLPFSDKLRQFLSFLCSCFLAPRAGAALSVHGYPSWQLLPVTEISWPGVALLALLVLSAVFNWNRRSGRLAALWATFSLFMLLVLGWGTVENGLILYSLYFGWAYLVLLFLLVQRLCAAVRIRFLLSSLCLASAAVMAAVNLPAMADMILFIISSYPL